MEKHKRENKRIRFKRIRNNQNILNRKDIPEEKFQIIEKSEELIKNLSFSNHNLRSGKFDSDNEKIEQENKKKCIETIRELGLKLKYHPIPSIKVKEEPIEVVKLDNQG